MNPCEQQTTVPLEEVPFWPCERCIERLEAERLEADACGPTST